MIFFFFSSYIRSFNLRTSEDVLYECDLSWIIAFLCVKYIINDMSCRRLVNSGTETIHDGKEQMSDDNEYRFTTFVILVWLLMMSLCKFE